MSRVAAGNRCKNLGLEINVKNCRVFFLTSNIKGGEMRGQNSSPDGKPSLPGPTRPWDLMRATSKVKPRAG